MKFSRVYYRKLRGCPEPLLKQLKKLNFGDNGIMLGMLNNKCPTNRTYIFYIYDQDKKVAAWAITGDREYSKKYKDINIYTKYCYRRKGLGTRLIRCIVNNHSKCTKGRITYHDYE